MARDRTAALTAAALLALATGASAAGCGAAKSAAKPASSSQPAPPAKPTAADLESQLLTVADMPPGFIADDGTDDANGTMSSTEPTCRPMTDLMNTEGHPPGALATASTSFTRSQFGPDIATGLAGFDTPAAAQQLLTTVTEAMRTCTKLTETDKDGSTYDFLVAQLPFPPTGDASGAIRVAADIDDLPAQVDLVLVRLGSTLLYVADTGFGGADSDLTQQVVTRAVAKVEDAAGADLGSGPVGAAATSPAPALAAEPLGTLGTAEAGL